MLQRMRRIRSRGSALLVVCAVAGILLTVVMVLHFQESVSRAAVMAAEGDLEARQVGRFELGRQLGRTQAVNPPWIVITQRNQLDRAAIVGPSASAPLFDNLASTGLRNLLDRQPLTFNKNLMNTAGSSYFDFTPRAGSSGLSFGTPRHLGVATEYSLCAIAAPAGKVKVSGDTISWDNRNDNNRERTAAIPIDVQAGNGANLRGFDYGQIWCNSGKVEFDKTRFNGIAHWGQAPAPLDVVRLVNACDAAMATLRLRSIDKTPVLTHGAPSINDVYKSLSRFPTSSDRDLIENLGLRGAQDYPLGIFFTISSLAESFGVYQMSVDVPFIPDGGNDTEFERAVEWVITKWTWLVSQLDYLGKIFDGYEKTAEWFENNHLGFLGAIYRRLMEVVKGIVTGMVAGVQTYASGVLMVPILLQMLHQKEPPNTRAEEADAVSKGTLDGRGRSSWGYRDVFGNFFSKSIALDPQRFADLLSAIGNVFTDFEFAQLNIVFNMHDTVKLVWFGPNGPLDGFSLGRPLTLPVTLDVPRDRTLRFATPVTIRGDLWLQRGSTLIVDGDLKIEKSPSADSEAPRGCVVLEDGATLIVNGNFSCAGTPRGGSVLVNGVMGRIHPVTSGILCSGNVEIPYGTRSGFAWDDLSISKDSLITDLMQPLSQGRAAALARTDGPFHPRLPYVAKYQTSFGIMTKPPMILPLPLQSKNIVAQQMRGLSVLQSAILNAKIGENLLTYADWWYFPGKIPAALKADFPAFRIMPRPASFTGNELQKEPTKALEAAREATNDNSLYSFTYTARFDVWRRYAQAAASFAKDAINKELVKMDKSKIPVGVPLLPDALFPDSVALVSKLDENVRKSIPDDEPLKKVLVAINFAMWDKWVGPDLTGPQVRQECGGALIYAGGSLSIGYKGATAVPRSDCRLAAGLLVARGSVRVNAESTIGALRSRDGSVTVEGNLYFYPPFTCASLYQPKAESTEWRDRLVENKFGGDDKRDPDTRCLPIGFGPMKITAWGPQK